MDYGRSAVGRILLVILAISMAGLGSYCPGLAIHTARAAGNSVELGAEPDSPNSDHLHEGLSLHGAKTVELHYIGINGQASAPDSAIPSPGFTFTQRLQAEVEGIWPGIWLQGSFDDDPFFPQYLLQVDMPNASFALGDIDTNILSPPLSACDLSLTGTQGRLKWGDFAFSLIAGHPHTLTQIETFALQPTAEVYQTDCAPILAGTEVLRIGGYVLVPHQDYLIDYGLGRIQLLRFWPEAHELFISYQIPDSSLGKKPLIQGLRGEYETKDGTLGLTHLSKKVPEHQGSAEYSFPQIDEPSYASRLTWSALSWEQGISGVSPHLAAEIWRHTSQPTLMAERLVEDMESHSLRHPLSLEISDPHRWSQPEAAGGSFLHLSKAAGWMPTEGITRAALQLDFAIEGSGARVAAILPLPAATNLAASNTLLLTLGLPQPLPGVKMEINLLSGSSGSFRQSVALGNLAGWQDIVLAEEHWEKTGVPTWEKITAVQLQLVSLLPGTTQGQVILGALDVTGASQATDRWQALRPRDAVIRLSNIPVPTTPWLAPPTNTALSLTIEQLVEPVHPVPPSQPARQPQVWGLLPTSFAPTEAEHLTFWAHAPGSNTGLTIWLIDLWGAAASPVQFRLLPGWHQYSISLAGPATELMGKTVTSIALAITPAPGNMSATVLLDEWRLAGVQSIEGYMGRFATSKDDGRMYWRLTGSGQTSGFQWDAPGMVENVPHPNHLGLEAIFYRPGHQHVGLSILQEGMVDGQTTLEFEANTWESTTLEARLTLPNSSSSIYADAGLPTGRVRLRTALATGAWELSAFQQPQTSRLIEPWATRIRRGVSLSLERQLTPGLLHLGTWHLAEGATGQTLAADLSWTILEALPVNTTLHIQRYQPSVLAPAEIGGFGRWETVWQSPDQQWGMAASFEQMVGRQKRSTIAQGIWSGALQPLTSAFPQDPCGEPLPESPRLSQQETALSIEWHPNERVTLTGQWQQDAAKHLENNQGSRENTGRLSISWPWSPTWQSRGSLGWSQSCSAAQNTIQTTEYSLSSEGAWSEAWTAGVLTSLQKTRWHDLSATTLSSIPHHGARWTLRGHTDYSYKPGGSIGLGLALAHQTIAALGLDSHFDQWEPSPTLPDPLYFGAHWEEGIIGETGVKTYRVMPVPGTGKAAGTYLDTRIHWALAQNTFYRISLGRLTQQPLATGTSRVDYYGQASVEKEWGALGTGRLEFSAGLGSQTAWALGLGWVKQLLPSQKGLYLKASFRHVQQMGYELTDTRLGLEYRF